MMQIIIPNLQLVFFFVYSMIENFKKVFIYYLTIGNIMIYHTTTISNILNKITDYVKFRVVKSWYI